jgi:hypothetical protein
VGNPCSVPSAIGGVCRFHIASATNSEGAKIPVDIDLELRVPPQSPNLGTAGTIIFQSLPPPEKAPPGPADKKDIRDFMALTAKDEKGPVDHFDPAVAVVATYNGGNVANRFLIYWDGISPGDKNGAWRRLPILSRTPAQSPNQLTALLGSFVPSDDVGDAGN